MTPHTSGTTLSAQTRYAAGTREILECWFEKRPIRDEYLMLACAISLMHLTRTVRPPAGSNPIIVMLAVPGWDFLLTPTLCGSVILVAAALVFNNWEGESRCPRGSKGKSGWAPFLSACRPWRC